MEFIEKWLHTLVMACTNISLGIIAFLVILQVTFRFVLNSPLPWPEELSRLVFVYLVFIGGAASSRSKSHIAIDVVDNFISSERIKAVLTLLRQLATALVLAAAAYGAVQIIPNITFMRLPATGLPMAVMIAPVLAGCLLMLFWTLLHLCSSVRSLLRDCNKRDVIVNNRI